MPRGDILWKIKTALSVAICLWRAYDKIETQTAHGENLKTAGWTRVQIPPSPPKP